MNEPSPPCALAEACDILARASRTGFDWRSPTGAWTKVSEELRELRAAAASRDEKHMREELGDLLFAVVALARWLEIDPEPALRSSTAKFESRLDVVRTLASPRELSDISVEDLVALWAEAKQRAAAA